MKAKLAVSKWRNIIGVAMGITLETNINIDSAYDANKTDLTVTDKTVTVGILH